MNIETMKMALEALEDDDIPRYKAITALRQAIEQAQQAEPVAWMWRCKPYCRWPDWSVSLKRPADSGRDGNKRTEGYEDVPLYTSPPPRQPEQCQCPECKVVLHASDCAVHSEPAYPKGECNCGATKPEPVAFINIEKRTLEWAKYMSWNTPTVVNLPKIPLYTSPLPRQPLIFPTMLRKMWSGTEVQQWLDENYNHGIKENT